MTGKVKCTVELIGKEGVSGIVDVEQFRWKRFKKRPLVIRAVQMKLPFRVVTLDGTFEGSPGDWLLEGIKKELYSCKNDIFKKTYQKVKK